MHSMPALYHYRGGGNVLCIKIEFLFQTSLFFWWLYRKTYINIVWPELLNLFLCVYHYNYNITQYNYTSDYKCLFNIIITNNTNLDPSCICQLELPCRKIWLTSVSLKMSLIKVSSAKRQIHNFYLITATT